MITRNQRHTKQNRCPVCDGAEGDPRGKEKRCHGWTTEDGEWCHCTREEIAGGIDLGPDGCYAHRLHGPCRCGTQHGEAKSESRPREDVVATYDYYDEHGALRFQVVRKPGKRFLQRAPDGAGGWVWSIAGVERVPYRLPELLAAPPGEPVYVVEGEKDVHSLVALGKLATCNPGGAGKWPLVAAIAADALRGRRVVIIADADEPGRAHAAQVKSLLPESDVMIVEPPSPYKDVTDYLTAGGKLEALLEAAKGPDRTPASRVRTWLKLGPVMRLPSGIPTLDRNCRGGLPTPRLVVFGGAPGAGKTSLATWMAWQWAKQGVPVAMLAVDEGPEGVILRMAQMEGFSVDRIEERDASTLERLSMRLEPLPITLVDSDDPEGTVEAVGALLAKQDAPVRVLVVDSLQTARAAGSDTAQSPKDRVDCVVAALKRLRDRHGFLIVATCELARGAYRSRSVAETINDLAAFKESGGIEYAAQTALVLRSVPDEPRLVDVTVPKNRAYGRDAFRLRMDFTSASFAEVLDPSGGPAAGNKPEREPEAPIDVMKRDVLRFLRSSRYKIPSASQLASAMQRNKDLCCRAVRELQEDGLIDRREGRLVAVPEPVPAGPKSAA